MNATRTILRALLLLGALAGMALGSAAHAQIAFRSATSAFIAGGGGTPVAPTLRSSAWEVLTPGATRFYPQPPAPAVNPTIRGNWRDGGTTCCANGSNVGTAYQPLKLERIKDPDNSNATTCTYVTRSLIDVNPGHVMITRMISEPLPMAQTIAGTLNAIMAVVESSNSQNAYFQLHVYVLRQPDTVVGTLLSNYAELSTSGNEWPATAAGKGLSGGAKTLSSVAAQAGDRIVIESGWVGYSTRADYAMNCVGTRDPADIAVGGGWRNQGTAWFEFSQDLFGSRISKPSGTVAGDVMIASIAVKPNTATITAPAGWTLVRRMDNATAPASSLAIYRRTADASDSSVSNYLWSTSSATSAVGVIQSFSGVDTANPIDVENGQATPSAFTHATPDVTTTTANTLLVASYVIASGGYFWTPPTGMTENITFGMNIAGMSIESNTVVQATAGATGVKTASTGHTPSGQFDPANTHILALRGVGGGGSTTLTITKPAGVAQNDVMIASIAVGPNTATITPPAGWALVRRMDQASGTSNSLAVYSKLAGASEAASYDWTFSAGHTGAAGGIQAFSGADPTIEVENGQNTASGTSHATPSVTTALNNTMIITSHGVGAATTTWTPPSGMSETVDANGGSAALETNYVLQAAAGASGAKSATATVAGTGNAHILALRRVLGSFNAFETSTGAGSISGVIKTKISGTTVSLDTAALNAAKSAVAITYVGTVRIEVLDASDNSGALDANNCRSTWTLIQTLSPDVTFAPSDNGRKTISFTQANSYPNARLRMSSPAGAPDSIGCSSDNFAIRPNQFITVLVTDNDAQTAGTTRTLNNLAAPGGIVHKAGRPFTVRATAVNGAGTPATTTNYAGTATATLTDCGATNACLSSGFGTLSIGGSFVSGQLTSNAATYSEVGSVAATLVDSTFASVDAADGSTAAEMNITTGPVNVGRFVPDHFAVALNTPSFGTACAAGGFTYLGQPFNYTTAPVITVTAQNFTNATTANYTGALWQITNTSLTGWSYTAAGYTPNTSGITGTDPVIVDSGGGAGTLTFGSGTGLLLTRTTTPVAPFNAEVSLAINVIDADGVAYATNPARFGAASAGNGIAFNSGKPMRFGRLALRNANGSQLVRLPVQVEAQYAVTAGAGIVFITNKDDSCTSLANNNVQMSSFTANLAACQTAISGGGALSSGRITLLLPAPGNANNGSVLLTANLGTSSSGTTCTSVGGGTVSAAGASRTYLQGNWAGSATYADNPSARAAFGTFKGSDEVIFIRENF